MKNFEEHYTAWLDGRMSPDERRAFEAGLPDRESALAEARRWAKLREDLREVLPAEILPNAEFLNAQILREIEAPVRTVSRQARFPLGRFAWAGAFLLLLGVWLALSVPRHPGITDESQFISQVIDARTADPKLGAYAFAAPGGKGAVLWLNDAGYIPANEKIK